MARLPGLDAFASMMGDVNGSDTPDLDAIYETPPTTPELP
jgi:hypothetical protein